MSVQFAVLASGSQGNVTLIQADGAGTLLDVGIGPRALAQRLESVGSSWERIGSVLLTHTHGDHLDNATLHRLCRHRITLYCHDGHRGQLAGGSGFDALVSAGLVRHYDERPFLTPTGLQIEPLELRHDSGPTYGFRVEAKPSRRSRSVSMGYLADTGIWTDAMADALGEVDLLGVEFNHDIDMLRQSRRSPALIARILGDRGHLSNHQGAAFLTAVLSRSTPRAVRQIVLLHLSRQCNHPTLAVDAAQLAVRQGGRKATVHAALQSAAYPNVFLRPARRSTALAAPREILRFPWET